MKLEQLTWLLQAVDHRLVTNLDEAEYKAECLKRTAKEIREVLASTAPTTPAE